MLVFLKNNLDYLKDNIFKCFFRLLFFLKKMLFFSEYIMMINLRPEKENIIEDMRNLFRREKETKAIKHRILRNIKKLFEHEEEDSYKPVRVNNFWSKLY